MLLLHKPGDEADCLLLELLLAFAFQSLSASATSRSRTAQCGTTDSQPNAHEPVARAALERTLAVGATQVVEADDRPDLITDDNAAA